MGGLVTCRRRSTFEPLPEPEPVSDNPDSETSSDYHQFDSPLSQAAVEEPEVSASQPDPTVVEGPEVAVSQPDPSTLILAEVRRTVGGFNLDFVRPEIVNWESTTLRIYCVWNIPHLAPPTLVSGLHWGDDCVAYAGLLGLNGGNFQGLRWRRCWSEREAVTTYLREAANFGLQGEQIRFFRWQRV